MGPYSRDQGHDDQLVRGAQHGHEGGVQVVEADHCSPVTPAGEDIEEVPPAIFIQRRCQLKLPTACQF